MIFDTFLRWSNRAKTQSRVEAASVLGKAVAIPELGSDKRQAINMAAAYLLDDLSPKVRMSLAESLADDINAPRPVILALTDDRADIAAMVVSRSPVLSDSDLIDIVARGSREVRAAAAMRKSVSAPVSAALIEVGGRLEITLLLRNEGARFTPNVMVRLSARCGRDATIRELMLDRADLPATAYHILIERAAEAISSCDLVMAVLPARKRDRLRREACDAAMIRVLGLADESELIEMAEFLRAEGKLTTAFLIHALCAGRTVFFAEVISNLSHVPRARARSILASGRPRAVRALIEAAGIRRDVAEVFCMAVEIWREQGGDIPSASGIFLMLSERCRKQMGMSEAALALADSVERLAITEMRQMAHAYVHELMTDAA